MAVVVAVRQLQEKCREQIQNLYFLFGECLWTILFRMPTNNDPHHLICSLRHGVSGGGKCHRVRPFPFQRVWNKAASSHILCRLLSCYLLHCPSLMLISPSGTDKMVASLVWRAWKPTPKYLRRSYGTSFLIWWRTCPSCIQQIRLAEPYCKHLRPELQSWVDGSVAPTCTRSLPSQPFHQTEGIKLNNVNSFTYLEIPWHQPFSMGRHVSNRFAKDGAYFVRLETGMARTLLCACDTWTLYRKQVRVLGQFHLRCLLKLMCISWKYRVLNTEEPRRSKKFSIEPYIFKAQPLFVCYVVRMDNSPLPNMTIFFSELASVTKRWPSKA